MVASFSTHAEEQISQLTHELAELRSSSSAAEAAKAEADAARAEAARAEVARAEAEAVEDYFGSHFEQQFFGAPASSGPSGPLGLT